MSKFIAINMIKILFLGWVGLAASSTNIYRIIVDDTRSLESYVNKAAEANNRNSLLDNIISRLKKKQPNIPNNDEDNDILQEKYEYDYDGYYTVNANEQDKNKNCTSKGANCMLLIPGKAPWVVRDNKEDSGYDRDDEDENIEQLIVRTINCDCEQKADPCHKRKVPGCKINTLRATTAAPTATIARKRIEIRYHNIKPPMTPRKKDVRIYHRVNTTANATTTTTPTTSTIWKRWDEKSTNEITSADMDMYIPDSFEQRSGKDEGKDYLDVDYLLRAYMQKNNAGRESNSEVLEPAANLPKWANDEKLLKGVRKKAFLYNYKKLVEMMKNKTNRAGRPPKKIPVLRQSDSASDSSSSQENSLEYQTTAEKTKYQKNTKTNNQNWIIPSIFDIEDTVDTYASESEEPEEDVKSEIKPIPWIPVGLADSSDTSSLETNELLETNSRIRLLEEMISRMHQIQLKLPNNKDYIDQVFKDKEEYDYDGYYIGNKLDTHKNCKHTNCMHKAPMDIADNKDTTIHRIGKINHHKRKLDAENQLGSGYDGKSNALRETTVAPKTTTARKRIEITYHIKTTTPKTTTTTRKKRWDEKDTNEITSADMDIYIPDSFEMRSGKGDRKFSEDYFDIDYLMRTYIKKNNTNRERNLEVKVPKQTINKEVLRSLRTNPTLHDDSRKWVKVKNKASRGKTNKKSQLSESDSNSEDDKKNEASRGKANQQAQSDSQSDNENDYNRDTKLSSIKKSKANKTPQSRETDSNSENDSNTSQEKSSEYKTTTKKTKYLKGNNVKSQKLKNPGRFDIVDSLNAYTSDSEEPRKVVLQKDSTETIERISEEVKPTKKSKPRIPGKPEHYMQGPSRLYKEGRDFRKKKGAANLARNVRKRMAHFLPKRYHWDPSDFHKLGYFWFNGPQGKVPGPWKISY